MSVAIDANLLLYATDTESPFHDRALAVLRELATGSEIVYLFWPVAMAYLRIVTHANVLDRPLSHDEAAADLESLLSRPHVRSPGEEGGFWQTYRSVAAESGVRGNLVSDAHLVSLMRQFGVTTIISNDRDFRKFDGVQVQDPFA